VKAFVGALLRAACGGMLLLAACGGQGRREVVVAAASDLTNALPELASAYYAKTGVTILPTFGASKLLATQIEQGAPFMVFMSANAAFVDDVVRSGRCDGATRALYARGHLALWARAGTTNPPRSLAELSDARFVHIAIANPETAPYGAAAQAALEHAGVWDQVAPRVVRGENIRQALQLAESGNADVAIVSRSLVIGAHGTSVDVDEALLAPIDQALVVCGPSADARAFVGWVNGAEGQGILSRWGLGR